MANFSTTTPVPGLTTTYTDVLKELNSKFNDVILGLDPATTNTETNTITNVPINTIRWSSDGNKWQKWSGSVWSDLSTLYAINISGNAATSTTATTLQTPRTINGVSFNGSQNITLATVNITGTTASAALPTGTTAQRDTTPTTGFIRFNTSINKFEGYNGTTWTSVGGGATGGTGDEIFIENSQTVNANYTIPATRNAMSTGPITVNNGITVTISTGARWVIL